MSNQSQQQYPDTAIGAKQALADMSVFTLEQMGRCQPDPYVVGVWKIMLNDPCSTFAIVYLAGYNDPFGSVRLTNDFESD